MSFLPKIFYECQLIHSSRAREAIIELNKLLNDFVTFRRFRSYMFEGAVQVAERSKTRTNRERRFEGLLHMIIDPRMAVRINLGFSTVTKPKIIYVDKALNLNTDVPNIKLLIESILGPETEDDQYMQSYFNYLQYQFSRTTPEFQNQNAYNAALMNFKKGKSRFALSEYRQKRGVNDWKYRIFKDYELISEFLYNNKEDLPSIDDIKRDVTKVVSERKWKLDLEVSLRCAFNF